MNQNSAADQAYPDGDPASSEAEPTGVDDPILRDEHDFLYAFINTADVIEARAAAQHVRATDFYYPVNAVIWQAAIEARKQTGPGAEHVGPLIGAMDAPADRHRKITMNALMQIISTDAEPLALPTYTRQLLDNAMRREAFVFADRVRQIAESTATEDVYAAIARYGVELRDGARARYESYDQGPARSPATETPLTPRPEREDRGPSAARTATTAQQQEVRAVSHRVKAALGAAGSPSPRRGTPAPDAGDAAVLPLDARRRRAAARPTDVARIATR